MNAVNNCSSLDIEQSWNPLKITRGHTDKILRLFCSVRHFYPCISSHTPIFFHKSRSASQPNIYIYGSTVQGTWVESVDLASWQTCRISVHITCYRHLGKCQKIASRVASCATQVELLLCFKNEAPPPMLRGGTPLCAIMPHRVAAAAACEGCSNAVRLFKSCDLLPVL